MKSSRTRSLSAVIFVALGFTISVCYGDPRWAQNLPMQAGPPVPELQEVQAAAAIPLAALSNQKLAALGAVDITAAPFQADATGVQDSTAAIQRGIFFAREHQMVLFFHRGSIASQTHLDVLKEFIIPQEKTQKKAGVGTILAC